MGTRKCMEGRGDGMWLDAERCSKANNPRDNCCYTPASNNRPVRIWSRNAKIEVMSRIIMCKEYDVFFNVTIICVGSNPEESFIAPVWSPAESERWRRERWRRETCSLQDSMVYCHACHIRIGWQHDMRSRLICWNARTLICCGDWTGGSQYRIPLWLNQWCNSEWKRRRKSVKPDAGP